MDEIEFLRTYGLIDAMKPIAKPKPRQMLFTPDEVAEMRRQDARRAEIEADAPYLGWPRKPPFHRDPLVCEIAELLLKVWP